MTKIWGVKAGASGVALVAIALTGTPATAEGFKPSIETNVRLGYDTNPFLSSGNDLGSGYAKASVEPRLTRSTAKGRISVSGHYEQAEYFERYGSSNQYGGELEAQQRVNDKLSVFGALRYDSNVIGQNDDILSGSPIDSPDVNLIGTRARADTYSATGGFSYRVSPKDTISADGGYTASRYKDRPSSSDSNNYGGRIAYEHAISQKTKIGVSGSVYQIDYDTPGLSTLVMQPNVTFSTELSPTWHFDAALGVSFSKLHQPGVSSSRNTGLAGSLNLCHKGSRNNFCLYGSRSVSGSGFGGSAQRTQIGMSFDQRLTETLSFDAGASYSRSESQNNLIGSRDYVTATAGLSKRVTKRLKVGVAGRYRDVFGDGPAVLADLGGEINATLEFPGPQ